MHKLGVVCLLLLLIGLVSAQDAPPMPEIDGDMFVTGLNGPQGVFVDSQGQLWVTESGIGGDEEITFFNVNNYAEETGLQGNTARLLRVAPDGTQTVVAELPSVTAGLDRIGGGRVTELNGDIYFTHGVWGEFLGDDVTVPHFGSVVKLGDDGELIDVASIWEHESAENPDGIDLRESHPYGLSAGADGLLLYVADAAANALVSVDVESGEVSTVTAFDPVPGVFPSPLLDNELLAQAVPTAVAFDDAGTMYVSYLTGAPFVPGNAKVVTVAEDGTVSDFATGLTMLTDMTYAPDGNLYVTQFAVFGQQGPEFNSGAVLRILPDGSAEVVISGLPNVTSVAFDADGNGYVAINGANPPEIMPDGAGAVVFYEDLINREGQALEDAASPAEED